MKIHLLGPCGSGTSTLGQLIANQYNYAWFDSDDFIWIKTDPPYTLKRDTKNRIKLLKNTLSRHESWVLSGSMLKWGDEFKPLLDIIIYLYVDKNERIKRLQKREREKFGERINPGNDMAEIHRNLIEYTQKYEDGGIDIRSKLSESLWLNDVTCKIIKIEGNIELEEKMRIVSKEIQNI